LYSTTFLRVGAGLTFSGFLDTTATATLPGVPGGVGTGLAGALELGDFGAGTGLSCRVAATGAWWTLRVSGWAVAVTGAVVLADLAAGGLILLAGLGAAGVATVRGDGWAALAGVACRAVVFAAAALVVGLLVRVAAAFFAGAALLAATFFAGAFFAGAAAFFTAATLAGFFAAGLAALVALATATVFLAGLATLPAATFLAAGLAVFPVGLATGEGFLAGLAAFFTGFLAATYEGSSEVFPASAGKRAFIAHPIPGGNLTGWRVSCGGDHTPAHHDAALLQALHQSHAGAALPVRAQLF